MTKYKDIHTNHLNDIISRIEADDLLGDNGALKKFEEYLLEIQEIGTFNIEDWKQSWREKIWRFGEKFRSINPSEFLERIDNIINEPTTNKEVIEFIRSEIIVNFLPDIECKKQIESLIEKYPLNPEFRNTLGIYYSREKQLFQAIEQYKLALKIDPKNNKFLKARFHKEQNYLDNLIIDGEYQKGLDYLSSISNDSKYLEAGTNLKSTFIDYRRRLNDHLLFENKLKSLEENFKHRINTELDSERKRIIEVLGFFSAIVAFILSTVSIGKNFSFIEASYFIIGLGIILILFCISMSTLFTNNKNKLGNDKKFITMIITLILLLVYILVAGVIAKFLN